MPTQKAYETYYTDLYFGTNSVLATLADGWVNQVNIGAQVQSSTRQVLGKPYPRVTKTRVDHRVSCQQALVGTETDKLVQNAERGIVVVRFTDSNDAISYECAIAGVAENAAAQGEIIGQITFQPRGQVFESTGWTDLTSGGVSSPGANALAVFTSNGSYTAGGSTTNVSPGIYEIPSGATAITGEGFVMERRVVN